MFEMPLVVVLFQIQDDCYIIHVKNNFTSKVEVIYIFILRFFTSQHVRDDINIIASGRLLNNTWAQSNFLIITILFLGCNLEFNLGNVIF